MLVIDKHACFLQVRFDRLTKRAQVTNPGANSPTGRKLTDGKEHGGDPDLVFAAGPGIRRLISGEVTPAEAIDREILAVVSGDAGLLERFAEVFHIDPGVVLVA